MSQVQLENTLKNLACVGRLISTSDDREVWRFEHDGRPYRVHFYPRRSGLARLVRGNPALRELQNFQRLQKAGVASPRAISVLVGFRLAARLGDALLLESIEPSVDLGSLLSQHALNGTPVSQRRRILDGVIGIMQKLARAGLGHASIRLRSFLVRDGAVYLADASQLTRGGLTLTHLLDLGHAAGPFATQGDYFRAWEVLGSDSPPPVRNRRSPRLWRKFDRSVLREGAEFGLLRINGWTGVFTRQTHRPLRWSNASQSTFTHDDWARAWPELLAKVEADQLEVIKRDPSGEVLRGQLPIAGATFDVIVKRPRVKFWWRHIMDAIRGSRGRRTWVKSWKMLARNVPFEWPMLLMERRVLGRSVDSVLVFERVPGATLATIDLDTLPTIARQNLFRRVGKISRRIEDLGFTHTDAKSTNWIVFDDPVDGPRPVLIDAYGTRHYLWSQLHGLNRLLRAMKQHEKYTPADSLEICRGFAPRAKFASED